jgi:hypothetical protein
MIVPYFDHFAQGILTHSTRLNDYLYVWEVKAKDQDEKMH